jgi:hypothetical protein
MKTNSICLIESTDEEVNGSIQPVIRSVTTFVNNPIGQGEAEKEFAWLAGEQRFEDNSPIFEEDEISNGWEKGILGAPTGDGWTLQVVRSRTDRDSGS